MLSSRMFFRLKQNKYAFLTSKLRYGKYETRKFSLLFSNVLIMLETFFSRIIQICKKHSFVARKWLWHIFLQLIFVTVVIREKEREKERERKRE